MDESLDTTSETKYILYVGSLNLNFFKKCLKIGEVWLQVSITVNVMQRSVVAIAVTTGVNFKASDQGGL